jgi:hypothetical protein
MKCFLAWHSGYQNYYKVDGFFGLIPMLEINKTASFPLVMLDKLRPNSINKEIGIYFNITKTQSLEIPRGRLQFYANASLAFDTNRTVNISAINKDIQSKFTGI